MSLQDWVFTDDKKQAGGQGTVAKVRHKFDDRIGALKRPHEIHSTAHRYRFLTEVSGLRAMTANGVPAVLEANEQEWNNPNADLYLVMDFIDGATMQSLITQSPPTLDQAIASTQRILEILKVGHALPLCHRDLKADNVILRSGQWEDPVLVDFGTASFELTDIDFNTPKGTELGNRFLRLPEFAPGGEHRDIRSDLAMAAGLFFFMLSGRAPRMLVDSNGLHPHEVDPSPIRAEILRDERWPKVGRLLRIAFQHRIESRFQSAQEFSTRLGQLNGKTLVKPDDLDEAISQLEDVINSAAAREKLEAGPAMEEASRALYDALSGIWTANGLQQGGQGPTFKNGGVTNEFYCLISRSGQEDPAVVFRHKIELLDGRLRASWTIDGCEPDIEFQGSPADDDSLRDALLDAARKISSKVIRALTYKLTPPATLDRFFK